MVFWRMGAGGDKATSSSVPMCSICLEEVSKTCGRTPVKLRCSHVFHLDCIGSTFNASGHMQCPNCREFENGVWRRFPELIIEQEGFPEQIMEPEGFTYGQMATAVNGHGVMLCPMCQAAASGMCHYWHLVHHGAHVHNNPPHVELEPCNCHTCRTYGWVMLQPLDPSYMTLPLGMSGGIHNFNSPVHQQSDITHQSMLNSTTAHLPGNSRAAFLPAPALNARSDLASALSHIPAGHMVTLDPRDWIGETNYSNVDWTFPLPNLPSPVVCNMFAGMGGVDGMQGWHLGNYAPPPNGHASLPHVRIAMPLPGYPAHHNEENGNSPEDKQDGNDTSSVRNK